MPYRLRRWAQCNIRTSSNPRRSATEGGTCLRRQPDQHQEQGHPKERELGKQAHVAGIFLPESHEGAEMDIWQDHESEQKDRP